MRQSFVLFVSDFGSPVHVSVVFDIVFIAHGSFGYVLFCFMHMLLLAPKHMQGRSNKPICILTAYLVRNGCCLACIWLACACQCRF